MATTSRISLAANTWVEIASGNANVLAQPLMTGIVEIVVAASAPTGSEIGHLIGFSRPPTISLNDLGGTDKVFARAIHEANIVAVTK